MSWYIPERSSNDPMARSSFGQIKKKNKKVIIILSFLLVLTSLILSGYVWANKEVVLHVDGKDLKKSTFAGNVGEFLKNEGIQLHKGDLVRPALNNKLTEGMVIDITRSFPVVINDGGLKKEVKTTSIPIKELLEVNNITLNQLDRITPEVTVKTYKDMLIKIVRVEKKRTTKLINVNFSIQTKKDNRMLHGRKKVIQKGVPGTNEQLIEMVYENGKVIKTKIIQAKVVKKPVAEIVKIGTRRTMSRGGRLFSYSTYLFMSATGYTHSGNRTSSGVWPHYGVVAVDPRVIPLGTRLYIEGYGYAVALDRGSAIVGNDIDLFFESFAQSVRWGRRGVKVYILN